MVSFEQGLRMWALVTLSSDSRSTGFSRCIYLYCKQLLKQIFSYCQNDPLLAAAEADATLCKD